ncbi:MAG: RNA polymerase sigma factor [Rubrobacter sp.]|nr:RNA polymerase sigma factor [Rubrobacter sp.]
MVREHSDLVYRVAFRLLGSDAAQEVWVRVWRKIDGFRGESSFPTWLYRIAFNTYLSTRNRRARLASLEMASVPEFLSDLPGVGDDPEIEAVRGEWAEELSIALLCIRAEHRDAVVLHHVRGLSYVEISRVLGIPQGTAKGWASRGRAELLVALRPHGIRRLCTKSRGAALQMVVRL